MAFMIKSVCNRHGRRATKIKHKPCLENNYTNTRIRRRWRLRQRQKTVRHYRNRHLSGASLTQILVAPTFCDLSRFGRDLCRSLNRPW
mgnify:CR=1 FL=1